MYKIYKTSKSKLLNPDKFSSGMWIDMVSPTNEELDELREIVDIDEDIMVAINDMNEVPKLEKYDGFQFILVQTPYINTDEEDVEAAFDATYSVSPLGIIYTSDYLITLSDGRNDVVEYLKLKLKNYQNNKIIDTENVPELILKLLLFTSKTYLRYLKLINKKIRKAQDDLEESPQNSEIVHLMNLDKSLVYFNTSLRSNQIVIEKLTKRKFFTSTEDDEELVEDILDENKQAIDMVSIYGKIISSVTTTFASIISNNLNQTVKFLTSITIILMIPTLVASVYGMNVELPFQHSGGAFTIVMMISLIFSMIGVVFFYRKKLF